jgi:SAM-dependent methyltransferase
MPQQLAIDLPVAVRLDPRLWHGSFNGRESTLQQLSPYVGKLKSGMVRVLLQLYSQEGDWVLDPFSGSGVVPLEALLMGRRAIANDLSPYAYFLTMGKLSVPPSESEAIARAISALDTVDTIKRHVKLEDLPDFVRSFFHPETLREVAAAFTVLLERKEYFLTSCLMGILHHVRPGFLSYPASHLTPYLRENKYPRDEFPGMYAYRALRPRLLAKIHRAYRRAFAGKDWSRDDYRVLCENSMKLSLKTGSVDLILSSPPYFGALDYARDNRLRLWFLGCPDWRELDRSLTASDQVYVPQMKQCLQEMNRVLKPGKYCVLVLGDVERNGRSRRTAEMIGELAESETGGALRVQALVSDEIPDIRRSRRMTRTTKIEKILVLKKMLPVSRAEYAKPVAAAEMVVRDKARVKRAKQVREE